MLRPGRITGRVLVLDFDDVILPSERMIDQDIAKFWYSASDKYARELDKKFEEGIIETRDELDAEMEIYRDKKNQILEEVYPQFEGRINYKQIINERNIPLSNIRYVRELIASKRYDAVFIESHYNSKEEKKCKEQLINKLFPGAFFLPVRFFEQDYLKSKQSKTNRVRTGKAEYIKNYLDVNGIDYDFSLFTLVDNSPSNIREWINQGGIGIIYTLGDYRSGNKVNSLNPYLIAEVEDNFYINPYDNSSKKK